MRKLLFLIVPFVLTAGLAVELGGNTVPFDPSRGLVEVQVTLDDRVPGRFGIDTGADQLYIDRRFAANNGFIFADNTRRRRTVGVENSSSVAFVDLESLSIGTERLTDLRASAIDISGLAGDLAASPPDGLIGFNILRHYFVTVDYPAQTVTLESTRPTFLSGRLYSEFTFRQYSHLILVDVTFDARVTRPMILDYCASITSISPSLARSLALNATAHDRIQSVSEITLSNALIGGDVTVSGVPAVVSDLAHYRRSVPRAQFEGILGGTFLSRLKLTIDYSANRIYVHRQ